MTQHKLSSLLKQQKLFNCPSFWWALITRYSHHVTTLFYFLIYAQRNRQHIIKFSNLLLALLPVHDRCVLFFHLRSPRALLLLLLLFPTTSVASYQINFIFRCSGVSTPLQCAVCCGRVLKVFVGSFGSRVRGACGWSWTKTGCRGIMKLKRNWIWGRRQWKFWSMQRRRWTKIRKLGVRRSRSSGIWFTVSENKNKKPKICLEKSKLSALPKNLKTFYHFRKLPR